MCFLTELPGPRGASDCCGNAVCCCFTKPGLGKQWSCVCTESTQKPNNRLQQSGWNICGTVSKCVFGRSHKQKICSLLKKSIYPCSFSWNLVYLVLRTFLILESFFIVFFLGEHSLKTIILWQLLALAKIIRLVKNKRTIENILFLGFLLEMTECTKVESNFNSLPAQFSYLTVMRKLNLDNMDPKLSIWAPNPVLEIVKPKESCDYSGSGQWTTISVLYLLFRDPEICNWIVQLIVL